MSADLLPNTPDFRKWLKAVFVEEFRLRSLSLRFSNPELFSESPWFPPALFIIYRLVVTSCCVIFTVESALKCPSYLWLLQYDTWSIISICMYFILSTCLLIYCTCKTWRKDNTKTNEVTKLDKRTEISYGSEDEGAEHEHTQELLWPEEQEDETILHNTEVNRLSCYHQTIWLLQTTAENSVLVTILCYLILNDDSNTLFVATYISFCVFLLADAIFCFTPIRLAHVVYAYLFTLLYLLVVVACYVAEDDHDVSQLPRFVNRIQGPISSTAVLLILIIGQPLFQTLYFCVHKLNILVYIKYYEF